MSLQNPETKTTKHTRMEIRGDKAGIKAEYTTDGQTRVKHIQTGGLVGETQVNQKKDTNQRWEKKQLIKKQDI